MLRRPYHSIIGFALLAILACCGLSQAQGKVAGGQAGDVYLLLLFSQDRDPPAPRFSHTYAAFVHARTRGGARKVLETHTISWLPASLDVRLLRRPEPGVNLSLKASLDLSVSMGTRISMWGPYQIKKELYDRAVRQEAGLKRGKILYKAIDGAPRSEGLAINCIHAVADIDVDRGLLETGKANGSGATSLVVQHLQRWFINPGQNYDWVIDQLGLSRYPITRRNVDKGEAAARK
jgi:hypothetical protein